jgi:type VI secretion system protein ImpB
MSSDSGQRFIKRNRPPRVQISYEDPYDSQKQIELPFVMGVMADLSGNASQVDKPAVADRRFSEVDMDNVDKYMESTAPAAAFRVENKLGPEGEKLGVNLTFKKLSDFSPGGVAAQVPALKVLLDARQQLANLQRYMDGKVGAETQLKQLLSDPKLMAALAERRAGEGEAAGEKDDEKE